MQSTLNFFIKDLRFWIIAFALLRLVNITLPPVEVGHNWRQTTVLMVARNFHEGEFRIFHPQVDMAGQLSGITGMEFPALNALHAMCASIFGFQDWYGRLIVLLVSSIAIWSFFALLRRVIPDIWARDSALLLVTSLWFVYSRKIMPDVFSCALVIIGTHLLVFSWESSKRHWRLWGPLGASALITLGVLSKLPAGIILIGMLPFLPKISQRISRHSNQQAHLISLFWLAPGLGLIGYWYFQWVPYLVEQFGFWHFFMGKPLGSGSKELLEHWDVASMHLVDHAMKFTGFTAFLVGSFFLAKRKHWTALTSIGCALIALLVVAFRAGDTFVRHDYYVLPFIPFMAMGAAFALQQIPHNGWKTAALTLIMVEGITNQFHDFFPSQNQRIILELEEAVANEVGPEGLIVINSDQNPAPLYFAHRKGWVMNGEEIESSADSLARLGATHVVWLKGAWKAGEIPERLMLETTENPWVIEPIVDIQKRSSE